MRKALLSLAAGVTAMLVSGSALANYHYIKIAEVFAGAPAAPNAHYVTLQMYADDQHFLSGHTLKIYNAAGVETGSVNLMDLAAGVDQKTILIGTASVTTAMGVAPDFTMPALTPAGGKVCFEPETAPFFDCFSWGNYTGNLASTTAPFAALTQGKAAKLVTTNGDPTILDGADDTDNSSVDFVAGTPAPKNNNGVVGALPDAGAPVDASVPPADAATNPPVDSGVGTKPTPQNEAGAGGGNDAGGAAGGGGSSDDSGCALGAHPADGSIAGLALVGVAAMVALSRRRRSKR